MTELSDKEQDANSVRELTRFLKMSREEEGTNISLPELPVTTVGRIIEHKNIKFHTFKLYKNVLLKDNSIVTLVNMSTLSVIVDRIKDFFGFESFNRSIVTFPSQRKYTMELHHGFERKMLPEEIKCREVIKIRYFRWLIGLPHSHPTRDIIVRHYLEEKLYVSYNDYKLEYDRDFDIGNIYGIDPISLFKEMLFGISGLYDLKDSLIAIINTVDPSYIYLADSICRKINSYGLLS